MQDSLLKFIAIIIAIAFHLVAIFIISQQVGTKQLTALWSGGQDGSRYQIAYVNLKDFAVEPNTSNATEPKTQNSAAPIIISKSKQNITDTSHKSQKQASPYIPKSGSGDSNTPNGGHGSGLDNNAPNSDAADTTLAMIRKKIIQHKTYPLVAKENHWTGTVSVQFKINADGSIAFAKITKTSGYSILDDAALKSITKAAPFPTYPAIISLSLEYTLK